MNVQRILRLGLLGKIVLFLAVTLTPLATITWWISVRAMSTNMADEFTSKGTAIARSLASSSVDLLLTRDASTVQAAVDQFAAIPGVAYVMVYDPKKTLVAHTFAPLVPSGIVEMNVVPGETTQQIRDVEFADPVSGKRRQIIDIGVPVLAGQLGTVRVGMDKAIIEAAAIRAGKDLLLIFGGVSVAAVSLPELSRDAATPIGNEQLRARIATGFRRIAFFIIPSSLAFAALGPTIIGLLFQTGRFDADDTLFVGGVLAAGTIGTTRILLNTARHVPAAVVQTMRCSRASCFPTSPRGEATRTNATGLLPDAVHSATYIIGRSSGTP